MKQQDPRGFTLVEVMLVVVILAILAAIALPRLNNSSEIAREKADITTGRQVKAALDRYQVEKGYYPKLDELSSAGGEISGSVFIPEYIKKMDASVTQQIAGEDKKGFGIAAKEAGNTDPDPQNIIMIYLTSDGSSAEVMVYNKSLSSVLWSSD